MCVWANCKAPISAVVVTTMLQSQALARVSYGFFFPLSADFDSSSAHSCLPWVNVIRSRLNSVSTQFRYNSALYASQLHLWIVPVNTVPPFNVLYLSQCAVWYFHCCRLASTDYGILKDTHRHRHRPCVSESYYVFYHLRYIFVPNVPSNVK